MGKVVKGALLGGAVGAVVVAVQRKQQAGVDAPGGPPQSVGVPSTAPPVWKPIVGAAAAGAGVGFLLDRRARRAAKRAAVAGPAIVQYARRMQPIAERAVEGLVSAADHARPHVAHAATVARERAVEAAEHARPHVRHAAEVALKRAEEAAEAAADAARPHMKKASKAARRRAEDTRKEARKRAEPLFDRAEPIFEAAKPRVEQAAHVARAGLADLAEAAGRHLSVDSNGHGAPKQIVVTLS